jgi:hypothetical protein
MTGQAIERRTPQPPVTQEGETLAEERSSGEAQTPTVIDVSGKPVARRQPSQAVTLVNRGLDLASSLLRLALWWMENKEPTTRATRPSQPASTAQRSTQAGAGGGRRRRHRRRGRSA